MMTYEEIQADTIRLVKRIRDEEDMMQDMERVLLAQDRNENGNFVFTLF
jgi:hypothetical protein